MLPFRKIVFAVDFSDACKAVVPYVKEAVERNKADLTLVHAFDVAPVVYGEFGAIAATGFPPYQELRKSECTRLQEFAREYFPARPQMMLEDGEPGSVITRVVKQNGADLIMLPTHGWGPFRRLLLGSVTAKVLHDVSSAVWTSAHAEQPEHKPHLPYQNIVCALNTDDEAPAIAQAAAAIAKSYGANLSLVHVIEPPPAAWEIDWAPYRKAVIDAADADLRRIKREANIDATVTIVDGPAADGVRNAAIERRADLVIVGRGQSQKTIGRIWSHLYGIVREAPCPVLSI
ncbi:MAG: universal stress protein [Bryobacteraceae bacterium]